MVAKNSTYLSFARSDLIILVTAFAFTISIFAITLSGELVYDSILAVQEGGFIHDYSNLWDIISFQVLSQDILDNNRPICLLSMMIDSIIWGTNPFGYKLSNILMHALNVGLFTCLLLHMRTRTLNVPESKNNFKIHKGFAVLFSILFAVHPITTEVVCVVSFREDLLVTGFVLAALLIFDLSLDNKIAKALSFSLILFLQILAIGSKETGITLIPLLAVWGHYLGTTKQKRFNISLITACAIIVAIFFYARFLVNPETSIIFTNPPNHITHHVQEWINVQIRIWNFQFLSLFNPNLLSCHYGPSAIHKTPALLAYITTGLSIVIMLWASWKSPICRTGATIIATALLPTSNIIPIYCPVADRYMYLPCIGVCLLLFGLLIKLFNKYPQQNWIRKAISAIGIISISILIFFTIERQNVFKNPLSLWKDSYSKYPNELVIIRALAGAHFNFNQYSHAQELFYESFKKGPINASSMAMMAIISYDQGDINKSQRFIDEAIKLDKRFQYPDKLIEGLEWSIPEATKLQKLLISLKMK